jgi:hypothetical protein
MTRPLILRSAVIAKLRAELYRYDETSTPGGEDPSPEQAAYDRGYRNGWTGRAESLIAWLQQGDVEAGLAELRHAEVLQLPRHWLAETKERP